MTLLRKWALLVVILVISALAHGINMFGFPYYENDEGVYVSQAYALLSTGNLSPYTYWYDHAPAGWILIALWQAVTGLFTFGTSVNSGRVLMLLLQIIGTGLVYVITKRETKSTLAAVIAGLVFSLSPLAIYFHRRVLLDNLATFWILVSVFILTAKKIKLWPVVLSALVFGVAVLSKEVAIFFLPGLLYMVWRGAGKSRPFMVSMWLTTVVLTGAFYLLFATLKGELLPGPGHVSLVSTLLEQLGRGVSKPFWDKSSLFYDNWIRWVARDGVLVWGGVAALATAILISIKSQKLRATVVLGVGFVVFLLRSKLIIDFYILPLIPFVAIAWGGVLGMAIERLKPWKGIYWFVATMAVGLTVAGFLRNNIGQYTKQETAPQIEVIEYVKRNVDPESRVVADSSIFLDLRETRFADDPAFPSVEWAWKVEKDQEVFGKKLNFDFRNIDYVLLSHEMLKQVREFGAVYIKTALDNSEQIALYKNGSTAFLDLPKYISTNGDWMGVYKVKDQNKIVLDTTWEFYKENYIQSYGQVVDPSDYKTTSEGQAYAMLRAVWQNDRKTFDGVWGWTQDHLQYREDRLLSWLWIREGRVEKLGDAASATDADLDAALALAFAAKKWGDQAYLSDARELIYDIFEKEVVSIGGRYVLVSGSGAKRANRYLVNPSYFSPAHYRIFAEVDTAHDWKKLTNDTYWLLDQLADKKTGLVPNWVMVDETTGLVTSARNVVEGDPDEYGFDAFRTYIRLKLDEKWFGASEGKNLLDRAGKFFETEWETKGKILAIYRLNGTGLSAYESLSTSVGAMTAMEGMNDGNYREMFDKYYEKPDLDDLNGYWGDRTNYYDQNWAWFAYAIDKGKALNLWQDK